jgi:hypothetical protein
LSLEDIAQNADAYNQQSDGGVLHNLKVSSLFGIAAIDLIWIL